ncbi:hypothetical protein Ccrd_002344 [Cynara cardunculus var. scolymus]|uniref:Peroxidase n=1 Tax=Cynara cardunculus var. scolymus TaxID=59895 RepID=A0A118JWK1_CYNCS|nr:hypothetical protein Ccrd_002344 [Cynara cardunculus var. scolymus]
MKRQGCVFLFFVLIFAFIGVEVTATGLPPESAPLIRQYYKVHNTCANVERFVRFQVKSFWDKDRTITPKLVKLLYADCMVNGCDASILLNGNNTEKASPKNRGLAGFAFIDIVKRVVESRRDGLKSEASWVDLPSPSISWESALAYFTSKGGHMMGRTRCSNVHDRLYNFKNTGKPDPSMESTTLSYLQQQCPKKVRLGQPNPLINLNPENPTHNFTNSYYKRVLANKAVLGVDQQLRYGGDTYELTDQFADSLGDLKGEFAFSMSRMGGLKVLTGTKGQIRRDCRVVNK